MLVSPSCEVTLAAQANEGTWEERAYGWRRKVLDMGALHNRSSVMVAWVGACFLCFLKLLTKHPGP